MVQRCSSPILALHGNRPRVEKLLAHQDSKSGIGAKKMKKSPPEMESVGKIPSYMKSTTSSDARSKRSPVSIGNPNSNYCDRDGSKSHRNPAKSARTSCSKLARVTTMNIRRFGENCSRVDLCGNYDSQRATCSSTLKDRKFPAYLALNHGGTQSEGTSALRVCPYTYCSLNGCHRAPLPPLKCFLSAKRAEKLGCGVSPVGNGLNLGWKCGIMQNSGLGRIRIGEEGRDRDLFVGVLRGKVGGSGGRGTMVAEDQRGQSREAVSNEPICNGVCGGKGCEGSGADLGDSSMELDGVDCGALFLGYEGDSSSKIEVGCDGESGIWIIHDELVCMPEGKSDCAGEFLADTMSKDRDFDSNRESDGVMQSLVDVETSLSAEVPMEEPEPELEQERVRIYSDMNPALFGSNPSSRINFVGIQCNTICDVEAEVDLASFDIPGNKPVEGFSDLTLENNLVGNPCNSICDIVADEELASFDNLGKKPVEDLPIQTELCNEDHQMGNIEDINLAQPTAKRIKTGQDSDELGTFNPRGPNFLPVEPDPAAEKVDLRHQELDEKKNTEEWMMDYALRQAVTKLGPERKRKVALLVKAFEKVMPIAKWELPSLGHGAAFDLARSVQACQ